MPPIPPIPQIPPRSLPSGRRAIGRLEVPPSKSLTNRYLNLALLAGRPLAIERPLDAEDTRRFRDALRACGCAVEERPGEVLVAPPAVPLAGAAIDCGASGTMMRFLTAALAALPGRWVIDGTPRLRERPVGPLVAALAQLGVRVEWLGRPGFPPLAITGGSLRGGVARLEAGESSQYLSALLMAALKAPDETVVEVASLTSEPYVEVTLQAITDAGGRVERDGERRFRVAPSALAVDRLRVEGDWSAACYPAAAAALTGGRVRLAGLRADSRQGDRGFLLDLLAAMGAGVAWHRGHDGEEVEIAGDDLRNVEADLSSMPDQVPTLAALAPFARGTTRISGVPHLRLKESDRLAAMARELGRLGAEVEETADGLTIPGIWYGLRSAELPAASVVVDPHDDHRIAMSLALVALRRPGVAIGAPAVVDKSWPGFWDDMASLLAS